MKKGLKLCFISLFLFSCSSIVTTSIKSINYLYPGDKSNIVGIGYTLKDYEPGWYPSKNTHFERIYYSKTKLELIKPKNKQNKSVIYWAHGGAFLYPLTNFYRELAEYMIRVNDNYDIVFVDYRQLPEHTYPEGNVDFENGLKWCMEKYDKVYVMGDSAGGNLVMSNSLKRRDEGQKLPDAIVLISPFLDISYTVNSRFENVKTDILIGSKKDDFKPAKLLAENEYFKGFDNKNPYISPVFGEFNNFPPTYIEVNKGELLFDDSNIVAQKLNKLGIENELKITENLFHDYIILKDLPESKIAIKNIFKFLDKQRGE